MRRHEIKVTNKRAKTHMDKYVKQRNQIRLLLPCGAVRGNKGRKGNLITYIQLNFL